MQIVDVTVTYTEEEKEIFNAEYECRNRMEDKEHELFVTGKEWNNHVKGNHTDIYSPIGFSVLAVFLWAVTIFFLSQGFFSFFAFVTAAPAFALAATVVAVIFTVKYVKQNKEYKAKEEELDKKREKLFHEYEKLKEEHKEKIKEVEAIVFRKTVEKKDAEERAFNDRSFEQLLRNDEKKPAGEEQINS